MSQEECANCVDFLRQHVTRYPVWRVFVGLLFTVINDVAGLFSASTAIGNMVHFVADPKMNILIVSVYMVVIDTGSEILLLTQHDIPLVRKKEISKGLVRVGLVGQILTALSWGALAGLTIYHTVVNGCRRDQILDLTCSSFLTGISSTLVVIMVLLKNSLMLKDYYLKAFVYPIICSEALLFISHLMRNEHDRVIEAFKKFNKMDENWQLQWVDEPTYNVIINVIQMVVLDASAIASVYLLIVVPGDSLLQTILRAIPFIIIVILNITSGLIIIFVHDIPICNQEEEEILAKNLKLFRIARIVEVLVHIAWVITLCYMIYVVVTLSCTSTCACNYYNPEATCPLNCTASQCDLGFCSYSQKGSCLINNTIDTNLIPPNYFITNCSLVSSLNQCYNNYPSFISCVLLALVLVQNTFKISSMFFKSYILPIFLPEELLYFMYVINEEHDKFIRAFGKSEFGMHWDLNKHTPKPTEFEM